MQTQTVSWDALPRAPVPDVRVLGVQPAGQNAFRGLVVTTIGGYGRFHLTLEPDRLVLIAFGERRVLPRLARGDSWAAQEAAVMLGLALITTDL